MLGQLSLQQDQPSLERKLSQKEASSGSLFPPEGLTTLRMYDTKWIDLRLQPIFTKALFPQAAFSPHSLAGLHTWFTTKHRKTNCSGSQAQGKGSGLLSVAPTVQVMHKVLCAPHGAGSHPWVLSCQNWLLPDLAAFPQLLLPGVTYDIRCLPLMLSQGSGGSCSS